MRSWGAHWMRSLGGQILVRVHERHVRLVIRVWRIVDISRWNVVQPVLLDVVADLVVCVCISSIETSRRATPGNIHGANAGKVGVDIVLPLTNRKLKVLFFGEIGVRTVLVGPALLPFAVVPVRAGGSDIFKRPFVAILFAAG